VTERMICKMGTVSKVIDPNNENIDGLNISRADMKAIFDKAEEYDRAFTEKYGRSKEIDYPYPRILPAGWRTIERHSYGAVYRASFGLRVILCAALHEDILKQAAVKPWLHVSMSYQDRLPSYADLCLVKKLFIGGNRTAYQVFPDDAHHVNINPHVLHLWCCLDGPVTPDFTRGLATI
jgi:hypothetical protein